MGCSPRRRGVIENVRLELEGAVSGHAIGEIVDIAQHLLRHLRERGHHDDRRTFHLGQKPRHFRFLAG